MKLIVNITQGLFDFNLDLLLLILVIIIAIIIIAKSGIIIVNQFERGIVERWDAFAKYISKDIQKEYSGYLESDWLNYLVFGTVMGVGFDVLVWEQRLGVSI